MSKISFILLFITVLRCCVGYSQAYWVYLQGEEFYQGNDTIPPDYKHAFWLYSKSAEMGCPMAEYKLSECYSLGRGVVQSQQKAFYWCRKSARHGYPTAQYMLGIHYFFGEGCLKNYNKSYKWIYRAADRGDTLAIEFLQQYSLYIRRTYTFGNQ